MLGKPEWFTYRMASWGIAPRTWQGWVYVGVFLALLAVIAAAPLPEGLKHKLAVGIAGLLLVDALSIWVQLGQHHDERERFHQLIIERNCSVAAVFSVLAALGYQIFRNPGPAAGASVDPLLFGILGVMALTKLVSTIYVKRRL